MRAPFAFGYPLGGPGDRAGRDPGTATDDDDMHEAELRTLRRGFARIMASPQIIGRLAEAGPSGR